ncbi:uncharacterized protein CDAR_22411 [Caerostris darwini]|uniref:Gustatory receptor n=1 Tax=Caerostris darwini TaxID=1538125 RepID=A0AAV4UAZ9_9ARAC|nr:uncharacterized protein CDAR_22411 [Caerostris darwini]
MNLKVIQENAFDKICKVAVFIGLPLSVHVGNGQSFRRSQKLWMVFITVIKCFAFGISVNFIFVIVSSSTVRLTFYGCIFVGCGINGFVIAKRKKISMSLDNIHMLSRILSPNKPIGNKFVKYQIIFHFIALAFFCVFMTVFFFYQEWQRSSAALRLPCMILSAYHDVCASLVFCCIIFSFCVSANISGTVLILCDSIFTVLSAIIEAYGKRLKKSFRSGNFSKESLIADIKMFNIIAKQVELVDEALSACIFLLYGMFIIMFYISVSIGLSKEDSFKTNMVTAYMVWNLVFAVFLFSRLTLSGSRVGKESIKLKNICMDCSKRIVSFSTDESVLRTFSLLLGGIKDTNLKVTGGGMFAVEKSLFLTVTGTMVTYGVVLFQMKE